MPDEFVRPSGDELSWVPVNAAIHIDLMLARAWVRGVGEVAVDTLLGADANTSNWDTTEYDTDGLTADGYVEPNTHPFAFIGAARTLILAGVTMRIAIKQVDSAVGINFDFYIMHASEAAGVYVSCYYPTDNDLRATSDDGDLDVHAGDTNTGHGAINIAAFTLVSNRVDVVLNGGTAATGVVDAVDRPPAFPWVAALFDCGTSHAIQYVTLYDPLPSTSGLSAISGALVFDIGAWTDQADGTTNIYTTLDESTASDTDFVQSPVIEASQADLVVRLYEDTTEIAEWTHTNVSETFALAEQTLTSPQLASISDFSDLFIELDDNAGSVYKFALGNPSGALTTPVVVRYRYKKLLVEEATTTTWNPSDTDAQTTLSGGDLTATTATGAYARSSFKAIASASTGKYYSEHTIVEDNGFASFIGIGVADATRLLDGNGAGVGGGEGYAYGVIGDGGVYWSGSGSVVTTIAAFAETNVVCMAVDLDNNNIWWRTNGGNWNNNGSADPATNTGGISISGISAGKPLFPMMSHLVFSGTSQISTANFGATAYAHTAPSGFNNWAA